jgi:hypothetical protein
LKTEKAIFQPIWNAMKICLSISAWYLIPILALFERITPLLSHHFPSLPQITILLFCIALFLYLFCFWLTLSRHSLYFNINNSLLSSFLQTQNTQINNHVIKN